MLHYSATVLMISITEHTYHAGHIALVWILLLALSNVWNIYWFYLLS